MTQKDFVELWRHEFAGLVADAFVHQAQGGELSLKMRLTFRKIDQHLAAIYESFQPKTIKPPSANGTAAIQPARTP